MATIASLKRFRLGELIFSHLTTDMRPGADRPQLVEACGIAAVQLTTP
jgi:hypothetical protein